MLTVKLRFCLLDIELDFIQIKVYFESIDYEYWYTFVWLNSTQNYIIYIRYNKLKFFYIYLYKMYKIDKYNYIMMIILHDNIKILFWNKLFDI